MKVMQSGRQTACRLIIFLAMLVRPLTEALVKTRVSVAPVISTHYHYCCSCWFDLFSKVRSIYITPTRSPHQIQHKRLSDTDVSSLAGTSTGTLLYCNHLRLCPCLINSFSMKLTMAVAGWLASSSANRWQALPAALPDLRATKPNSLQRPHKQTVTANIQWNTAHSCTY